MHFTKRGLLACLVMMTMSMGFMTSCGDDDDDVKPANGGNASGWFKAEGNKTDFKYGYLMEYNDEEGYELMYSTFDALDFRKNPVKYVGRTVSTFSYWADNWEVSAEAYINAKMVYDEYDNDYYAEDGTEYDMEFDSDIAKRDGDKVEVKVNGIEAEKYIETEYGEGTSEYVRVDFSFSGKPTLVTEPDYDEAPARNINIVKVTDPEEIKFLKSFRHNRK